MTDDNTSNNYWPYWGKAKKSDDSTGPDYHLLAYHSLDVAAVAWFLMSPTGRLCRSLAKQLGVEPTWLKDFFVFCLILHDIGKFFRSFQNLVPNMSAQLVEYISSCTYSIRHDTLGYSLWRKSISKDIQDLIPKAHIKHFDGWMKVVCGHHGEPPESLRTIEPFLVEADKQAALNFVRDVITQWMPDTEVLMHIDKRQFKQASWQLAGVAVLADWLGSNQDFFSYCATPMPLKQYWSEQALIRAEKALNHAEVLPAQVRPFESIQQQFEFIQTPTPLQQFAQTVTLIKGQQLSILEDVTGAGKTEAAMALLHRLMSAGEADGVYIGLPTMATSNGMYQRIIKSYRSLFTDNSSPSLVLSHSARNLSDDFNQSVLLANQRHDKDYDVGDLSASAYCNQWLADTRKKALLADVGVGTIDQALLGILPAKHQSLRLLGISNKVLLVDEVHAFDAYMEKLLTSLLKAHAAQGGSVILLSATLPKKMRQTLIDAYTEGAGFTPSHCQANAPYPLVSQLTHQGLQEHPVATRASVARHVNVERLDSEKAAIAHVERSYQQNHCICWIRNTVKDAINTYQAIIASGKVAAEDIQLFHSRYAMIDRQSIEQDVLARFGKTSTQTQRRAKVLIATQVVEQSLDLDFDEMISDLAPIDLLIQRAGRLQRHIRDAKGNPTQGSDMRTKPILHVLSPDPEKITNALWLKAILPGTQAVYGNVGQLWLSIKILLKNKGFRMPEDARQVIEYVYGDQDIPQHLQAASDEANIEARCKGSLANFNCLDLTKGYARSSAAQNQGWSHDVNIPTRLSHDTADVALVVVKDGELKPYANLVKHAWQLSQLSVPLGDWEKSKPAIPANFIAPIEALKAREPSLKWVEVFPLTEETKTYYNPTSGWKSPANAGNVNV